jgi:hypothetical protein
MGDARFLNDRTERRYGIEVVTRIIDTQAATVDPLSLVAVTRSYLDYAATESNLHVCSLSERHDSISQWQRYGADGHGYCVGLDTGRLSSDWLDRVGASLHQMVYDTDEQERLVRDRFAFMAQQLEPEVAALNDDARQALIEMGGVDIAIGLEEVALQLKHPLFRDELEWRLIREVNAHSLMQLTKTHFAVRGNYVKPYIEIELPAPEVGTPIVEVVCGPRLDGELAIMSAQQYLANSSFSGVSVRWSELHEIWR